MKAGLYARVSTENQDLESQEENLQQWAIRNDYDYDLYSEKVSSIKERPKFEEILENLDEYDIVAVRHLDRFGRTTRDILQNIDLLKQEGVAFYTLDQPIDTREDSIWGEVMTQLLSVFAELERKMIRRRMQEGYEEALEEGRVGRPKKVNEEQLEEATEMYEKGWSVTRIHAFLQGKYDDFDAHRSTLQKTLKREGVIGE